MTYFYKQNRNTHIGTEGFLIVCSLSWVESQNGSRVAMAQGV